MNIFALWGEIEINRKQAEQDIVKVEKQAEKSGKKMESSFDKVTKVVATAIKEIDKYGDKIEKFGKNLSKKAGVPFAALTALMGGLAKATANYTSEVEDNAAIVGLSTKSYQELQYAMQQSGLEQGEFIRMMGRVNQRIGFARQGNEKYRKSLEEMGFALEDVDAGLVSTEEGFLAMIQYLHEMDDVQKQAAMAGDFFGTMLSRRMMPLIRDGADSVEELRERAQELGLVMDDLVIAKGNMLSDTLDDMAFTAKGLGRIFGSEMHAPMINISRAITDLLARFSEWLTENPKVVRQIVMWGGALAGVLGVLVTLGTTLIVTGKIIGVLGKIFNILISKPMLIIAAIGLLYLAWESDWLGIKTVTETVVAAILALWDSLVDWWENDPLVQSMKQAWADAVKVWEELTLPEKTLGLVAVAMTITWALTFLKSFVSALIGAAGITEATGAAAGLAKFAFTLGALAVAANVIWQLLPEDLQEDVGDLWGKVGKAIEDYNTTTINNPFVAGIATWLQNLDEEGWEIPTLTVTVLFMAFKLLQKGLALAMVLGKAIGAALGTVAIPLLGLAVAITSVAWFLNTDEERAQLEARIAEIWKDESLTMVVKVGKITIELLQGAMAGFRNQYLNIVESLLGEDVRKEMEETESAMEEYHRYLQAYQKEHGWFAKAFKAPSAQKFMGDPDKYWAELTGEVAELTGELSKLEKQALIVAEVMKQGGTMEQAMAILGIAYWETRGHGGYTHTDPTTGEVMRGGAGEYGIGQVMPGTGKDVWTRLWGQPAETWDESMLKDLDTNIAMMVSYFLDRYQAHGEDLRLAIEGYNRGTAIDGMQAYTVGVVEWMEGAEGQSLANILYDGMENALEAMVQAGYDMDGDVREMAAFIAQSIADYLVGQSPPPEGPLSNIKLGMKNTMDAGIEGAEEGLLGGIGRLSLSAQKIGEATQVGFKEGLESGKVPVLKVDGVEWVTEEVEKGWWDKAIEWGKNLFGSLWELLPEDLRTKITAVLAEAEELLYTLPDLQEELINASRLETIADSTKTFMEQLTEQLEKQFARVAFSVEGFVSHMLDSSGVFGTVLFSLKTIADSTKELADANEEQANKLRTIIQNNWIAAILSLVSETESFALAMELLGAILDPVITLFDNVFRPVIEFIVGLWNSIMKGLAGISIFGWRPFKGLEDKIIDTDPKKGGSGDGGGRGGRQVSEITGPTRDLLVDLLSPLANFGAIVAPIQDIRNILYERLPNFDAFGMDFAGAGAIGGDIVFESGAIVINSSGTSATELSRDMLDAIDREMGRRYKSSTRGRGGGRW